METFDDAAEIADIHFIETERVDMEPIKRLLGDLFGDDAIVQHLRKVADPSQQTIGNAGRSSGTAGNFRNGGVFNVDIEDSR